MQVSDTTLKTISIPESVMQAENIQYNNENSGLDAENTQDAIDELESKKLNKSSLANNLTTTAEGMALDARQGKVLNDAIDKKASKSIYKDDAISMGRMYGPNVGKGSVAIGANGTYAEGDYSLAIGIGCSASEDGSFAFGENAKANGSRSCAIGTNVNANGNLSFALGFCLTTYRYQTAIGYHNDITLATEPSGNLDANSGTAFVIGNGHPSGNIDSNAFRVTYEGKAIGKSAFASTGADYAEYFEWQDGNTNNEDRVGYFVTFADGNFIKKANEGDYILGIVSGMPCVIGNNDECWRGKYEMDDFGRFIYENQKYTDKETGEEKECTFYKVNPDYDENKPYIHRENRPEWSAVGIVGVLSVYDDGTCQVNGYCKCADGGIATACERGIDTFRVIERVNNNIIKVVLK